MADEEKLVSSVSFRITRAEKDRLDTLVEAAHLNLAAVLRELLTEWMAEYEEDYFGDRGQR